MMHAEITKQTFLADMQVRGLDNLTAETIWDYMINNYTVTRYNPDVIFEKFEAWSADEIRTKFEKELLDFCKDFGLRFDLLTDTDVFYFLEEEMGYYLVERVSDNKVLFDVEYYGSVSESY